MFDTPSLVIFGTSFLVGLSGAVSPGPLLTFTIRETLRLGFLAGPYISIGHAILELFVVILLALGINQFLDSDIAAGSIGVLGGLFLIWTGSKMVRGPSQGTLGTPSSNVLAHQGKARKLMLGGALVSLSNPYWTIWWLSVGATFMTRSMELGLLGIGAFYFGHILSDISWYSLVSFAIASGRRLVTHKVYKGTMLGCSVFLIAMGGYFIVAGVGFLV